MILYGAALKLFAFGALVVRVVLPVNTGNVWLDWPVFLGGMFLVAIVIGVVESTVARLKMTQVPILLIAACLLSGFGIVLLVR
jgi:formate hydrogenlyase subunit 4